MLFYLEFYDVSYLKTQELYQDKQRFDFEN